MFSLTPVKKVGNGSGEFFYPTYPYGKLRNEFDAIFNRMFGGFPVPFENWGYPEAYWAFNTEETEKEYLIYAEAPGFDAKDFNIFVTGNVLTLKAEHKTEMKEEKGKEFRYAERCLERNVTLPAAVKADKIEASYKNGILEVHVPKAEEAKPRHIAVKT